MKSHSKFEVDSVTNFPRDTDDATQAPKGYEKFHYLMRLSREKQNKKPM